MEWYHIGLCESEKKFVKNKVTVQNRDLLLCEIYRLCQRDFVVVRWTILYDNHFVFWDNSIYHKICALTCGRIISAPTDLYKKKRQHNFCTVLVGADDGARTRYLHLGKVALYQMSYIRILLVPPGGIEPPTRGFSVPCSTDWATEAKIGDPERVRTVDL